MSYFFKRGEVWKATDERALDLHKVLPPGNYIAQFNPDQGFYLVEADPFPLPSKIYGDVEQTAERILSTYEKRPASTGVLLAGEKGSGKTLLSKMLSVRGAAIGIPTVIVNTPLMGDGFNKFLQDIDQPCIVLFDEFEKTYDKDHQPMILTLFDGVYPSKKLFLLTVNDKWRVDEHMRNRPGRLYYMLDYTGLDPNFIREYAMDNLNDKTQIEGVIQVTTFFEKFNFDMLKALIEEMNRYDETAKDSIRYLNISPLYVGNNRHEYTYTVYKDGVDVSYYEDPDDRQVSRYPQSERWNVEVKTNYVPPTPEEVADGIEGEWDSKTLRVSPKELKAFDVSAGRYEFVLKTGHVVVLEKSYGNKQAEHFYEML